MRDFRDVLWIELRKVVRSRLPWWTGLGSLFMPMSMALLIFLARNPGISKQLGLVSAKANLVAYAATDWQAYLSFFGLLIAAGGFFFSVVVISWVFGREFVDGTLKDMLAVPVLRIQIVLAKFTVATAWAIVLTLVTILAGLATGALMRLPGGSPSIILQGSLVILVAGLLMIADVLPFGLLASVGRGYLLPLGLAILAIMAANVVGLLGWAEYFPWAIPGIYVQGKSSLGPVSYAIVMATGLIGVAVTYLCWKYADQNR